jgi:hypothetical protein
MNLYQRYLSSKFPLLMGSVALASALGIWGCSDSDPAIADNSGSGGSEASAGTGGSQASGGNVDQNPGGGAPDDLPSSGGASSMGGSAMGGAQASGGNSAVAGAPEANGGTNTAGAAQGNGGTDTNSGGTTASSGGAPANGGSPDTGTGGVAQFDSICTDENGDAVPYDYSFGLMSEYAFELSMSCDVGGYIMPLVVADPEQLSEVNAFVSDATDWYRSQILKCKNDKTKLGPDAFGLLPASQTADLSKGDFDATESLFFQVLSRHDGLPDGVSPNKKDHIKGRINSIKAKAVHQDTDTLTKTLSEPDCMPSTPQ